MPLQSKAQLRKFFVMEQEGELPKGTAKKWLKHTKDPKKLPELKKEASKELLLKLAEGPVMKFSKFFVPTRSADKKEKAHQDAGANKKRERREYLRHVRRVKQGPAVKTSKFYVPPDRQQKPAQTSAKKSPGRKKSEMHEGALASN